MHIYGIFINDLEGSSDCHLPYTSVRRVSNFMLKSNDRSLHDKGFDGQQCKQSKAVSSHWSLQDQINTTNTLSELCRHMKNSQTLDQNMLYKVIAKEWDRRPEMMNRLQFFYHILTIMIESGVHVTNCTEHQPPCRPKVVTSLFERNAIALKNFISSVNRHKLIVIEVELLAALEFVAYAQPRYRPAVADIMDILFRKGVVEAVAFGEWSQMESHRPDEKARLIQEIKASGFTLLKRSSSL